MLRQGLHFHQNTPFLLTEEWNSHLGGVSRSINREQRWMILCIERIYLTHEGEPLTCFGSKSSSQMHDWFNASPLCPHFKMLCRAWATAYTALYTLLDILSSDTSVKGLLMSRSCSEPEHWVWLRRLFLKLQPNVASQNSLSRLFWGSWLGLTCKRNSRRPVIFVFLMVKPRDPVRIPEYLFVARWPAVIQDSLPTHCSPVKFCFRDSSSKTSISLWAKKATKTLALPLWITLTTLAICSLGSVLEMASEYSMQTPSWLAAVINVARPLLP